MDEIEFANLGAELSDQLRRTRDTRDLLLSYVKERVLACQVQLSARLLDERESDTLRGNIAELNKLKDMIQNGGTQ